MNSVRQQPPPYTLARRRMRSGGRELPVSATLCDRITREGLLMGMELIGRRLSADELRAVLDDPTIVDTLLYGDLDDEDAEMPDPSWI
jgi:hypothetical protein